MLFSSYGPVLDAIKTTLTGAPTDSSDPVLTCCGNKQSESHAPSCHCGSEVIRERLFSMKEVSQHCEPQSCWVVVNNIVYDLTEFIYDHPGGMDIMLEHAGTDCTGAFEDVGHSRWAVKLLQKYKIGMLRPEERILL